MTYSVSLFYKIYQNEYFENVAEYVMIFVRKMVVAYWDSDVLNL